jgi:aquaporin related protein
MNNVRPVDNPLVVLPFTKTNTLGIPPARPLPGMSWMPLTVRNHFIAFIGEFVGTFLFLFFAFAATQVANMIAIQTSSGFPSASSLLYISLAFSFSLCVNVWIFFRISGGLFNPAVVFQSCFARFASY